MPVQCPVVVLAVVAGMVHSAAMAQGNGIDLGAVYQLLTEVAEKVSSHDRRFDAIDRRFDAVGRQFAAIDGQFAAINSRFAEIDRRLGDMTAEIGGLREAVTGYHASVLGHGVLISELDERVRRIERHLRLEPTRG